MNPRDRDLSEAEKARQKAERDLHKIKAETPMYRALGESLRELRERNHLAEAFEHAFRKVAP